MYQEIEIPKRGKHSMSKDLPVHFFFLFLFFSLLLLSGASDFSAFSAMGQNTSFQDTCVA